MTNKKPTQAVYEIKVPYNVKKSRYFIFLTLTMLYRYRIVPQHFKITFSIEFFLRSQNSRYSFPFPIVKDRISPVFRSEIH